MNPSPTPPLLSLAWSTCLLYAAYLTAATAVDPSSGVGVFVGMATLNMYRPREQNTKGRERRDGHGTGGKEDEMMVPRGEGQVDRDGSVDGAGAMARVLAGIERVVVRPYNLALMSWGLVVPLVGLAYLNLSLAIERMGVHPSFRMAWAIQPETGLNLELLDSAQMRPGLSSRFLVGCLLPFGLVVLGARIRLSAYKELGPSFTFKLNAPRKLVTTGLYAWVRHPSYTGTLLVWTGAVALAWRADGVILSCLVQGGDEMSEVVRTRWVISGCVIGLYVLKRAFIVGLRVPREEKMMGSVFGAEWERYRRRVKWRLVPGVW